MGNKLKKHKVTVVQAIASDIVIEAKDKQEAEEKALETRTYQRVNHRVVSEYAQVEQSKANLQDGGTNKKKNP